MTEDNRDNDYHMKASDVAQTLGGGLAQRDVIAIQRQAVAKIKRGYARHGIGFDSALAGARLPSNWNQRGRRR